MKTPLSNKGQCHQSFLALLAEIVVNYPASLQDRANIIQKGKTKVSGICSLPPSRNPFATPLGRPASKYSRQNIVFSDRGGMALADWDAAIGLLTLPNAQSVTHLVVCRNSAGITHGRLPKRAGKISR